MTRTTPARRMILHFSHRTLTDGLTFTISLAPQHQSQLASFERGLCPRNPFLGEASEGAVEAPSDYLNRYVIRPRLRS